MKKRISSALRKLRKKQREKNLVIGKYKQRRLQENLKEKLEWQNRFAEKERSIIEAGLKHEPFKPGRYAGYYEHSKGTKPPFYFMSMEEEWMRGSSPGSFLTAWVTEKKIDQKTIDKKVPQIKLIPKEKIPEYLSAKLMEGIATSEERREIDRFLNPTLKKLMILMARGNLAAIDWAEQTYGMKIEVDSEILKWIGKVS